MKVRKFKHVQLQMYISKRKSCISQISVIAFGVLYVTTSRPLYTPFPMGEHESNTLIHKDIYPRFGDGFVFA